MGKDIIILIVVALLFSAIGVGLGIIYQKQTDASQSAAITVLRSKVVPSVVAYGSVAKIEGNKIVLNNEGESAIFDIKKDASVSLLVWEEGGTGTYTYKKAELSDIKVGDILNIVIKILPEGQLQGESVFINPKK
jgi:hypothetical protein